MKRFDHEKFLKEWETESKWRQVRMQRISELNSKGKRPKKMFKSFLNIRTLITAKVI